ncbi:MAG: hypothetical protein K2J02_00570 [Malacoplasma sp.]|nr:hypothetical protein [Malacoplasma sp.]MDE5952627.1 hypothetical protein [Malacoplasma sp.]MDE6893854.1 hypothetical protein [Malacoplasma sp.]MDE7075351.1 hypothetical protein [Malacoplasma sp.]MDE7088213.1 hypothetical protein [Malacoplasma sp.]
MEKVINKTNANVASMNLKHIRNIAISSLVMEVVAVILGFVAFWLIKDILVSTMAPNNLNVSAIFNAFDNPDNLVSLILISAFMFITFIAFFVLPTVSACYFGWRLEPEHKGILKTLILATPASLLFLPFVVLAWPITILVLISKSEIGIKKELAKAKVNKVETTPQKRVVDLTTTVTEVKKVPQSVVYRPGQNSVAPRPPVNTVIGTRPASTVVYRPATTTTTTAGTRPANTVYVRTTRPTTV